MAGVAIGVMIAASVVAVVEIPELPLVKQGGRHLARRSLWLLLRPRQVVDMISWMMPSVPKKRLKSRKLQGMVLPSTTFSTQRSPRVRARHRRHLDPGFHHSLMATARQAEVAVMSLSIWYRDLFFETLTLRISEGFALHSDTIDFDISLHQSAASESESVGTFPIQTKRTPPR